MSDLLHKPWHVYDLLLDMVPDDCMVEEISIGLTWTYCRVQNRLGLAMSPESSIRTLAWPGSLQGRPARQLAEWIKDWDPFKATIGMAAINATIYHDSHLLSRIMTVQPSGPGNLAVFEYFYPMLQDKKIVVIGRYPNMDKALPGVNVTVLERNPGDNDLPDVAAEYILRDADWVFLTATSLINKTFPRLVELAADATLVLMGPTTPWLTELREFGVDYLAGVQVHDRSSVIRTINEGGGTRLFESGLDYCIVDLGAYEMDSLKTAISDTVSRREHLKAEMETWFSNNRKGRFPLQSELLALDDQLSSLDTRFKQLWEARH